jgi:hypothetical protein
MQLLRGSVGKGTHRAILACVCCTHLVLACRSVCVPCFLISNWFWHTVCNTLQGSCARVAEDACSKLPKKLGRAGRGGKAGSRSHSSGGRSMGGLGVVLGATAALAGVLVMAGLYRREVAGVVQVRPG